MVTPGSCNHINLPKKEGPPALGLADERRKSMVFGRRGQTYPAVPTNQKQRRATLGAALSKTLSNNREQLIAT